MDFTNTSAWMGVGGLHFPREAMGAITIPTAFQFGLPGEDQYMV